jgi:hypothetical protein
MILKFYHVGDFAYAHPSGSSGVNEKDAGLFHFAQHPER